MIKRLKLSGIYPKCPEIAPARLVSPESLSRHRSWLELTQGEVGAAICYNGGRSTLRANLGLC